MGRGAWSASSLYPRRCVFSSFIGTDGVSDIVSDSHPVAARSIRVSFTFGRIGAIPLEDIGKIKNPGRAFKKGQAGKETKTVF